MDIFIQTTSIPDDKENLPQKILSDAQLPVFSPARNPLRDVNQQQIFTPSKLTTSLKKFKPATPRATKTEKSVIKQKHPITVFRDKRPSTPSTPGRQRQKSYKAVKIQKVVRFEENLTVIADVGAAVITDSVQKLQEEDDELDEKIGKFIESILQLTVEEIHSEIKIPVPDICVVEILDNTQDIKPLLPVSHLPSNEQDSINGSGSVFQSNTGLSTPLDQQTKFSKLKNICRILTADSSTCTSPVFMNDASAQVQPLYLDSCCSPLQSSHESSFNNNSDKAKNYVTVSMADVSSMTDFRSPVKCEQEVQVHPVVRDIGMSPFRESTKDVQMSTETVCFVDRGNMAKPDLCNMYTMTDTSHMKTKETSMTPVKSLSKQGKRLTAEDIRRQHPRVIANQLDTTLVCNARLTSEVKSLEHEKDKLKNVVKDLKLSLTNKQKHCEELESQNEEEKSHLEKMNFEVVREVQSTVEKKDEHIAELEKEVFDLKAKSTESENKTTDLEMKYQKLEQKLITLEEDHTNEVQKLKEEYERTNYHQQFERSQEVVRELQAQLDEFYDVLGELEDTEKLQTSLQNSITETHIQLRHVGIQNADMRKNLLTKYVTLQKLQKDIDCDMQNTKQQNQDLVEKCSSLTKIVEISSDNVQQLQTLYVNTASDLQSTTAMVHQMNKELSGARKAIQDLLFTKGMLIQYLDDQQEKEKLSLGEIQALTTALIDLEKDLHTQKKLTQDVDLKRIDAEARLEENASKHELLVTNLQRTLDFQERDLDLLTKDMEICQETIQQQRCQMKQFQTEKHLIEENIKHNEENNTTLKRTALFMEAERDLLLSSLKECEERMRTMSLELNRQERAVSGSEIQCLQLQSVVQSLHSDLCASKEELESTKTHARRMLIHQGLELRDCGQAIDNLDLRMRCILQAMKRKVGNEDDDANVIYDNVNTEVKKAPRSLVCAVLEAVNLPASKPTENNSSNNGSLNLTWSCGRPQRSASVPLVNQDSDSKSVNHSQSSSNQSERSFPRMNLSFTSSSPGEDSRSRLGYSQSSAFSPVKSKPRSYLKEGHEDEAVTDDEQTRLSNSQIQSPILDGSLASLQVSTLVDQILTLGEVLGEIVRMANIVERASQLSIEDLKGEEMVLTERISQLESQTERLRAEIILKDEELTLTNQEVVQLQSRNKQMVTAMMDVSDQQSETKKLKTEIERLMRQMKWVESEKQDISDQHNKLLEQLETKADGHGVTDTRNLREIAALKRENHQLRMNLCEDGDRYQEMGNKAARKIKILEDNWKKAEAEVFRFDELVETIRKVLEDNKAEIESNASLAELLQIVNGEDIQEPVTPAKQTWPNSNTSFLTQHTWSLLK